MSGGTVRKNRNSLFNVTGVDEFAFLASKESKESKTKAPSSAGKKSPEKPDGDPVLNSISSYGQEKFLMSNEDMSVEEEMVQFSERFLDEPLRPETQKSKTSSKDLSKKKSGANGRRVRIDVPDLVRFQWLNIFNQPQQATDEAHVESDEDIDDPQSSNVSNTNDGDTEGVEPSEENEKKDQASQGGRVGDEEAKPENAPATTDNRKSAFSEPDISENSKQSVNSAPPKQAKYEDNSSTEAVYGATLGRASDFLSSYHSNHLDPSAFYSTITGSSVRGRGKMKAFLGHLAEYHANKDNDEADATPATTNSDEKQHQSSEKAPATSPKLSPQQTHKQVPQSLANSETIVAIPTSPPKAKSTVRSPHRDTRATTKLSKENATTEFYKSGLDKHSGSTITPLLSKTTATSSPPEAQAATKDSTVAKLAPSPQKLSESPISKIPLASPQLPNRTTSASPKTHHRRHSEGISTITKIKKHVSNSANHTHHHFQHHRTTKGPPLDMTINEKGKADETEKSRQTRNSADSTTTGTKVSSARPPLPPNSIVSANGSKPSPVRRSQSTTAHIHSTMKLLPSRLTRKSKTNNEYPKDNADKVSPLLSSTSRGTHRKSTELGKSSGGPFSAFRHSRTDSAVYPSSFHKRKEKSGEPASRFTPKILNASVSEDDILLSLKGRKVSGLNWSPSVQQDDRRGTSEFDMDLTDAGSNNNNNGHTAHMRQSISAKPPSVANSDSSEPKTQANQQHSRHQLWRRKSRRTSILNTISHMFNKGNN
ncbi:hypothetical protein H4219_002909 [Mycoemilia scoparia]|uniref:Uncharacterized protein n=1 Tax=Mycoemilia scoparia TaxID=417184 RepID=A0A9W8DTG1_9FUNG|nr:hypothetical protein H4219_002909 [Mycoemilia scoparia]